VDWLSPLRELSGAIFPILEHLPVIRAVLGIILVFFLPGFAWTLVFFRQINVIERIALSFGLSMAVIILSVLFLNMMVGGRITGFNSALIIIAGTIIPLAFYYLSRLARGRESRENRKSQG